MHYSYSHKTFYGEGVDSALLPPDALAVTETERQQILRELSGPAPSLADQIDALMRRIDRDADRITEETIGARGEEYRQAEADALAFKAAGYTGAVPPFVASYVTAKVDWTAKQAADDILATANTWRVALGQIRASRLLCKELARKAAGDEGLTIVLAQWNGFVTAIRAALGLGPA